MSPTTVTPELGPIPAGTSCSLAGRFANARDLMAACAVACDRGDAQDAEMRASYLEVANQLERTSGLIAAMGATRAPAPARSAGAYDRDGVFASTEGGVFAVRGRCELLNLVEFVGFVASLRRDGVLQVQCQTEEFIIQLEAGCVLFAAGENPHGLRLSQILLTRGALSHQELVRAEQQCRQDEYLGEALQRLGLVEREVLIDALSHQVTIMFCRMHMVGSGFDFQFEEGTRILLETDIRLSVSELLRESKVLMDRAGALLAEMSEG